MNQPDSSIKRELILEMAEELSQAEENQKTQVQIDFEQTCQDVNQNVMKKLEELIDSLQSTHKIITSQFTEDLSQSHYTKKYCESIKVEESITPYNKISYQLTDDKVKQQEFCGAVEFNKEGNIMVAGCNTQIKVWRLEYGQLKEQIKVLEGHKSVVYCLAFSKKTNWFASGSADKTIRCWKDMGNNKWKSFSSEKVHTSGVLCILLNRNEDQVITGSRDHSIKIWSVDQQNNIITFYHSLDQHQAQVNSISLNASGTNLISFSPNQQIIIWRRGKNSKWSEKYQELKTTSGCGYRICFINDNIVVWQEAGQGFTNILKLENSVFIEKPEHKIKLLQGCDGDCLFPSVYNYQKQILIYVLMLKFSTNFQI